MDFLIPVVLNGLCFGLVVGLLALGFTQVIGATHLINFAQGEVYMLGAFSGAAVAGLTKNLLVALLAGAIIAAVVNVVIYFVIFQRIRRRVMITTLLAGLGASLVIRTFAGQFLGVTTLPFPELGFATGRFSVGGQSFSLQILVLIAAALVLLGAGFFIIYRTQFGLQVRALSDSFQSAEGIGLNVVRLQASVFAFSGALSGAAGVLTAWYFGTYNFSMGVNALALAFAAAVIGGLGSLPGAVLGGIAVGLVRSFGSLIDVSLIDAFPFIFLIAFLLVRPTGLFGKPLSLH